MQNLPDLEPLVRGTSRGDRKSEERLFSILYTFVQSVIRKRWRNSISDAEIADIQLDCLEKLLATFRNPEKAEKVLEQGRVFGFVHVVAENTALDYNRKRNRRGKIFLSINEISDSEDNPQWESKLSADIARSDISDIILGGMESARMLGELEPRYRDILTDRISGLEYDEIASKHKISLANARQIHKRGVNALRQNLIQRHRSLLSALPVSQSALLKRLYMKDGSVTATEVAPATEEEALSSFYELLLDKGLIIFIIGILLSSISS